MGKLGTAQKCVYFRAKTLAKAKLRADNEDVSFSRFVDRCVAFYLDNHKDLFDVDTDNNCGS